MSDAIKLKKIFLANAISQLVADNQYVSDKDIGLIKDLDVQYKKHIKNLKATKRKVFGSGNSELLPQMDGCYCDCNCNGRECQELELNGEIERWGLQGWGEFCI